MDEEGCDFDSSLVLLNLSLCSPGCRAVKPCEKKLCLAPSLHIVHDPHTRRSALSQQTKVQRRRFSVEAAPKTNKSFTFFAESAFLHLLVALLHFLICRFILLQLGPYLSSAAPDELLSEQQCVCVCVSPEPHRYQAVCVCLGGSDPRQDPERGGVDIFPPSLFTPVRRKTTGKARRGPFVPQQCVCVCVGWGGILVSQQELIGSRGGENRPRSLVHHVHILQFAALRCVCVAVEEETGCDLESAAQLF